MSGEVDRKTAVPRTRCTDAADLMKTSSGSASCSSRLRISARPVAQVVSTVKIIAATTSGNQPPSAILVMFEAKKAPSTIANSPIVSAASDAVPLPHLEDQHRQHQSW